MLATAAAMVYSVSDQEIVDISIPPSADPVKTGGMGDVAHTVPSGDDRLIDCGGQKFKLPGTNLTFWYRQPDKKIAELANGDVVVNCVRAHATARVQE